MWENYYEKPYQTWQAAVKTFKKHQNVSTENTKRDKHYFIDFYVNIHCF